jgi:hypothetical protein
MRRRSGHRRTRPEGATENSVNDAPAAAPWPEPAAVAIAASVLDALEETLGGGALRDASRRGRAFAEHGPAILDAFAEFRRRRRARHGGLFPFGASGSLWHQPRARSPSRHRAAVPPPPAGPSSRGIRRSHASDTIPTTAISAAQASMAARVPDARSESRCRAADHERQPLRGRLR